MNVRGYKPGPIQTKVFKEKIVIKPGGKKRLFFIDRDQLVPLGYVTKKEKKMPFEEYGTELVNQNNPECKVGIVVLSQNGNIQSQSVIGKSFEILAGGPANAIGEIPLFPDGDGMAIFLPITAPFAIAATGALALGTAGGALIATAVIPVTATIDLIKKGLNQASSIGVNTAVSPACNNISVSVEHTYVGRIYKDVDITINPTESLKVRLQKLQKLKKTLEKYLQLAQLQPQQLQQQTQQLQQQIQQLQQQVPQLEQKIQKLQKNKKLWGLKKYNMLHREKQKLQKKQTEIVKKQKQMKLLQETNLQQLKQKLQQLQQKINKPKLQQQLRLLKQSDQLLLQLQLHRQPVDQLLQELKDLQKKLKTYNHLLDIMPL